MYTRLLAYTLYILSDHRVYISKRWDQIVTEITADTVLSQLDIFLRVLLLARHLFKLLALPCYADSRLFAAGNNYEIIVFSILGSAARRKAFSVRKHARFC